MFIRKWRYEMQLESARLAGKKEGRQETVDQFHGTVTYLEAENARLTKELQLYEAGLTTARKNLDQAYKDIAAMQKLIEQKDEQAFKKSDVIWIMAKELACCQRIADKRFYEEGDQEASSMMLMQASAIMDLANELGICGDVYAQAVELYDFRNSGKEGYTLKDGKIVKVEEEIQEQTAQETEMEETETPCGCCEEAVEETVVECPFCDDAQPGDCCQENNGMIHETD